MCGEREGGAMVEMNGVSGCYTGSTGVWPSVFMVWGQLALMNTTRIHCTPLHSMSTHTAIVYATPAHTTSHCCSTGVAKG